MANSVQILLPIFPSRNVYFIGYISVSEVQETILYITDFAAKQEELTVKHVENENVIFGYCSENSPRNTTRDYEIYKNMLVLEKRDTVRVKSLTINGKHFKQLENCIIVLYDHNKFKSSETINDYTDHFSKLQILLNNDSWSAQKYHEPILKGPYWISSSMFAQHVINYFNLLHWAIITIKQEKKLSVKLGNMLLAIFADMALGYIVLDLITQDKKALSLQLMGVLEKLVSLLHSLLQWLMGSPAGLKLNNAFNKLLGKYFSYHIQLWWLFLDVSGEKLGVLLQVYHCLGYFGITFQAAMVSDLICITTFHSYCIYVYAARLFNIQVSGLIALLRLFVGRKYNPLRGGIDSCEYTNQELFVGTVAFTILLLLLPTTTMYYIVFTLFKLLSLMVQYILAKLIYIIQTLPLYVIPLWLLQSPKVAGNILIQVENTKEGAPLVLRVKLFNKSLQESVNKCKPPVEPPKQFEWSNVLSNIFRGKQLM